MSVEMPHAAADGAGGVRLWKVKGEQVRITCGEKIYWWAVSLYTMTEEIKRGL